MEEKDLVVPDFLMDIEWWSAYWLYIITAVAVLVLYIIVGRWTKKWGILAVTIICLAIGGLVGYWVCSETLAKNCFRMDEQLYQPAGPGASQPPIVPEDSPTRPASPNPEESLGQEQPKPPQ